ncbi:MAG TPA: hypothetical protein DDW52_23845 [Planctomycetaceae bacterium]|nr:hypothetical protein [Planctomycetaceae bacterium]
MNPQLGRIIKRAGLEVWPKRWQNLRATRATELEREFPSHVVTGWCGHTERIAKEHYWMTVEEDFQKAAKTKSVHFVSMQGAEDGGNEPHAEPTAHEKSPEIRALRNLASYREGVQWRITDMNIPPLRLKKHYK